MKKTKQKAKRIRKSGKKVSKKTKRRRIRRAVRHARKISVLRGSSRKSKAKSKKSKYLLLGTSYACKQQADLDRARGGNLYGEVGIMPGKGKVMPWFKKKSRRGRRRSFGFLGADSGAGSSSLTGVLKNGALTVAGAAAGSLVAARMPLPASMAKFRGLLPVVAGVALGMSKFGRRGIGAQLALGMVVAGGLAIGRQYSPQLFAGEDEMLGLPQLDQALGIEYQSGEGDADDLGLEYQNGESVDDVELFGDFSTGADA